MFSKKNDTTTPAKSVKAERLSQDAGMPSVIAAGLAIEGNLISDGDIHVDGSVTGNITAREVVVGNGGSIKGEISASNVRVLGAIEGQVEAKSVTLANTAKMVGDVIHSELTIEPGAFLEGHCRRITEKSGEGRARAVAVLKQLGAKEAAPDEAEAATGS